VLFVDYFLTLLSFRKLNRVSDFFFEIKYPKSIFLCNIVYILLLCNADYNVD
jgi:hypothetical protein